MIMSFTHLRWKPTWTETLLLILIVIIFARQSAAVTTGASASVLLQPLYLVFNTLIFVTFSRIPLNAPAFRKAVKYSLIGAVLIAVGAVWLYGSRYIDENGAIVRATGSFNNPNQLGYFALCVTSLAAVLYLRGLFSGLSCVGIWGAAAFLVVLSASRAAVLGVLPALLIGVSALGKKRVTPLTLVICLLFAAGVGYLYVAGQFEHLDVVRRMQTNYGRYNNLSSRGWDVMPDTAPQFLFGRGLLGEELDSEIEVHVTFWSFMVDYGIFAFLLFMAVWLGWIRRVYQEFGLLGLAVIAAPATLYGLSHNGSRFTIVWVLIGLCWNRSLDRAPSSRAASPYGPAMPFGRPTTVDGPKIVPSASPFHQGKFGYAPRPFSK